MGVVVRVDLLRHQQTMMMTMDDEENNVPSSSTDNEFLLLGGIASIGEYYVYAYVDDQKLRLQVDTGSSSLVVAGNGCANCSSRSLVKWNREDVVPCDGKICSQCFDGTDSCGFRLKYGDDTPMYNLEASGVVLQTDVRLSKDGENISKVTVYVIQKEVGLWPKKVDGILGMAFEKLNCNPTCFEPAWHSFAPANAQGGFDICMGDVGGKLSFFGKRSSKTSATAHDELRLDILGNPKMYYAVRTRGLAIEDSNEEDRFFLFTGPSPGGSAQRFAIVDTGTTLLIVPQAIWNSFVNHMQSRFCHLDGVCGYPTIFDHPQSNEAVCLTESPLDSFPTLALILGDGAIKLPPSLYFIRYEHSVYCLGIQPGPVLVVGDAVLRGFTVSFGPDTVTFTSQDREEGCGEIFGFKPKEDLVIPHVGHIGIVHHQMSTYSFVRGLISFGILLVLLYILVQAWRRYMRRRLGYTEL